jgi:hypothetical protein
MGMVKKSLKRSIFSNNFFIRLPSQPISGDSELGVYGAQKRSVHKHEHPRTGTTKLWAHESRFGEKSIDHMFSYRLTNS